MAYRSHPTKNGCKRLPVSLSASHKTHRPLPIRTTRSHFFLQLPAPSYPPSMAPQPGAHHTIGQKSNSKTLALVIKKAYIFMPVITRKNLVLTVPRAWQHVADIQGSTILTKRTIRIPQQKLFLIPRKLALCPQPSNLAFCNNIGYSYFVFQHVTISLTLKCNSIKCLA